MVVRSQEEVIVLTMGLSAEECLELHRETGAYDRFTYMHETVTKPTIAFVEVRMIIYQVQSSTGREA